MRPADRHLAGRVAALIAQVAELPSQAPVIEKVDLLAAKLSAR
jgi:hypothetical protein